MSRRESLVHLNSPSSLNFCHGQHPPTPHGKIRSILPAMPTPLRYHGPWLGVPYRIAPYYTVLGRTLRVRPVAPDLYNHTQGGVMSCIFPLVDLASSFLRPHSEQSSNADYGERSTLAHDETRLLGSSDLRRMGHTSGVFSLANNQVSGV